MAHQTLVTRVERVEQALESLAHLPGDVKELRADVAQVEVRVGAVESQLLRLHPEMKDKFCAVRREAAETRDNLLEVIQSSSRATLRMFGDLRTEMRASFADLGAQMRSLHEDVIDRIRRLGKGHAR